MALLSPSCHSLYKIGTGFPGESLTDNSLPSAKPYALSLAPFTHSSHRQSVPRDGLLMHACCSHTSPTPKSCFLCQAPVKGKREIPAAPPGPPAGEWQRRQSKSL